MLACFTKMVDVANLAGLWFMLIVYGVGLIWFQNETSVCENVESH